MAFTSGAVAQGSFGGSGFGNAPTLPTAGDNGPVQATQSGNSTLSGGSRNITFPVPFKTAPNVIAQSSSNANTGILYVSSITATGFAVNSTVGSDTGPFNWTAFGNPS